MANYEHFSKQGTCLHVMWLSYQQGVKVDSFRKDFLQEKISVLGIQVLSTKCILCENNGIFLIHLFLNCYM